MNDVPEIREAVPARHIAAVVVGNALEFYDFLTYSFFAVYIGRAFFPSSDPSASLLASLATFGALREQQLQDFGWRIAFLAGAAIVPFGLAIRRGLPETFHAPDGGKRQRIPLRRPRRLSPESWRVLPLLFQIQGFRVELRSAKRRITSRVHTT